MAVSKKLLRRAILGGLMVVGVVVIAFTTGRDGNSEIYVMNADGSGQTNLTNHPADDRRPVWSSMR